MSTGVADIFAAAMSLPEGDRASLALELLRTLRNPAAFSEDDPDFFAELERRSDACDRGESVTLSWEEVDRQLRQELEKRRSK